MGEIVLKKFIVILIAALLLLSFFYSKHNDNRIKKTKGSIIVFKIPSNLRCDYNDENDIKTIISVINNAKKINASYEEVEKEYKERYEIYIQHDNGNKSIYSLWTDGYKLVMAEQWNGTLLISSEDTLKFKELLGRLD